MALKKELTQKSRFSTILCVANELNKLCIWCDFEQIVDPQERTPVAGVDLL